MKREEVRIKEEWGVEVKRGKKWLREEKREEKKGE